MLCHKIKESIIASKEKIYLRISYVSDDVTALPEFQNFTYLLIADNLLKIVQLLKNGALKLFYIYSRIIIQIKMFIFT
jgi:hypothetical protein